MSAPSSSSDAASASSAAATPAAAASVASAAAAAPAAPVPAVAASTTKPKSKKRKTAESRLRSSIAIALICQSNLNRSMEAHWLLQEEGNMRAYSFGAGTKVRLPGETLQTPHVYEFGTPYTDMYRDLERANRARYTKNGMLQMLDRDRQLKEAPERWQDHYDRYAASADAAAANKRSRHESSAGTGGADEGDDASDTPPLPRHFDLVICYETRVYDMVSADIEARGHSAAARNQPVHLLNIDTTDNHAEAAVSAQLTLELCRAIYDAHRQARGGGSKGAEGEEEDEEEDDTNAADNDGASWEDSIDTIIDEFEQKHGKEVSHTVLFY